MERIKRLLEEMGRNKRTRSHNRFNEEDMYSRDRRSYKDKYGRNFENEDEDYDRMENYGRRNKFGRFNREEDEDEENERYGRNRYGRMRGSRFSEEEDEDEEYPQELKELEEEVWDYIEELKKEDPELFCLMKCDLWKALKGPHFDEEFAEEAVEDLCEEFGKREPRWKCDEAKQIAEKFGIKFGEDFNKHDWYYALNLMYLLFSQVMQDNLQSYAKCAHAWLNDKSIPEGKSFWHYHRFLKTKEEE